MGVTVISEIKLVAENLPSTIKNLIFGWNFNQQVDNLPSKIKYLMFGKNFNQLVDNLPNSVKHLILGNEFNMPIDALRECTELEEIILGNNFKIAAVSNNLY